MTDDKHQAFYDANRGPYGTNVGDTWTAPDSVIQEKLDEDGQGLVLVHEVILRDGEAVEVVYVTDDAELISKATDGLPRYAAQKASEN